MLEKAIKEIKEQGKDYEQYSNNWNVMQQLIDIISADPHSAEIVFQDLSVEELNLNAVVKKITGKHIANPFDVMKEICEFYAIPCPSELPPEQWRSATTPNKASGVKEPISLIDLL